MSKDNSSGGNSGNRGQERSSEVPHSEALKAAVERIKDQPFLFVIAMAIVLAPNGTNAKKCY